MAKNIKEEPLFAKAVAERLKFFRTNYIGKTQQIAAEKLNYTQAALSLIESGAKLIPFGI